MSRGLGAICVPVRREGHKALAAGTSPRQSPEGEEGRPRLARSHRCPRGWGHNLGRGRRPGLLLVFGRDRAHHSRSLSKNTGRRTEPSTMEGSSRERRLPSSAQCREKENSGEPLEGTESLSPTPDDRSSAINQSGPRGAAGWGHPGAPHCQVACQNHAPGRASASTNATRVCRTTTVEGTPGA